ncbi:HET domain-containing protein [Rutstroemia sp. NJR-2017a BBW]|nr:HET domain-containing protein [Rutstroemia sp. NJR-2017a BBW]
MRDVYRQARRILMWLGDSSPKDDVQLAFAFLNGLPASKAIENLHKYVFKHSDITRVQKFLQRPWFHRRWIIQDVVLGHDSTVQCGPFQMSWHWFVDAHRRLQMASNKGIITSKPEAQYSIQHAYIIYLHFNELLSLIWDFHKRESFDPRDRIFALHSYAENVVPSTASETSPEFEQTIVKKTFPVDYTSPYIEVYRHLALEFVASGF